MIGYVWIFPGNKKITPHRMLSNPCFWEEAKWGTDRCDRPVREVKIERQRTEGLVEQQRRETEKKREREGMWGRKKMEVRRERERKRGEKRRGETAVGGWMGVSMVMLSSFSTCRETMVLTMWRFACLSLPLSLCLFSILQTLLKQRVN